MPQPSFEEPIVGGFVVEGELGGRSVRVSWHDREIEGDRDLIDLAALAIDAGETYIDADGAVVAASFDTMPGAMLAVCRAVDRIAAAELHDDS